MHGGGSSSATSWARLQELPGVSSATASLGLPLATAVMAPFLAEGQPVVAMGSARWLPGTRSRPIISRRWACRWCAAAIFRRPMMSTRPSG